MFGAKEEEEKWDKVKDMVLTVHTRMCKKPFVSEGQVYNKTENARRGYARLLRRRQRK
jgi:hypothetical protein